MGTVRHVAFPQGTQPVLSQHRHHGLVALLLVPLIAGIASIAVITVNEPRTIWGALTSMNTRFSSSQSSWFAWFFLNAMVLYIATVTTMVALLAGRALRFVESAWVRVLLVVLATLQILIAALAIEAEPSLGRGLARLDPFAVFFVLAMVNAVVSAALFASWKSISRI